MRDGANDHRFERIQKGLPAQYQIKKVYDQDKFISEAVNEVVQAAFNAHQRRDNGAGRLLGPDALDRASSDRCRTRLPSSVESGQCSRHAAPSSPCDDRVGSERAASRSVRRRALWSRRPGGSSPSRSTATP